MKQRLQTFVSEIHIPEDGLLHFRGQPIQASATPEADDLTQMTEFVYKYLYTHPSGVIKDAFRATAPDARLIEDLKKANTTRCDIQQGWIVRTPLTDGSVVAERAGIVRKFMPGQFLAEKDTLPIHAGSQLTVTHLAGSMNMQPGFFHMFGQEQSDMAEQQRMIRVYFNLLAPGTAASAAHLLTRALNTYKIPFIYKTATRLTDFSRSDTAVLYLSQRFFRIFHLILTHILKPLRPVLATDIPMFTRSLGPGIGFAEDPDGEISFGAARSKIVAQAILSSRCSTGTYVERFWSDFCQICDARSLDLDALHLNAGSTDTLYFPPASPEIAA
ncbi:T3SS effector HopA1 family protein [Halocynthiibacter styelae]|uniref:Uncharacterized protein n=1 Tax=Halocynthiibacter styelae TaxID=2761955 RepID=A0A8J7LL49_9RHOB|nr:T3SS effector HopA1 family protein [Paenihalocynthiibacter styelae]MBI1494034.1 hypothetical protein [Paenihalocynthiibacter styelae]